jgi:hypothetical protein
MRLDLDDEQIRRLQEHTEGWAAGLQLVGLSLPGRADADEYIATFAGDDRQIVDYLPPKCSTASRRTGGASCCARRSSSVYASHFATLY